MWLIIRESSRSGERDRSITTEYGGVKYTIGPKPVKVPDEAGEYIARSFSGQVEVTKPPEKKKVAKKVAKKIEPPGLTPRSTREFA